MFIVKSKVNTMLVIGFLLLLFSLPNGLFWLLGLLLVFTGEIVDEANMIVICLFITAFFGFLSWLGFRRVFLVRNCKRYDAVLSTMTVTTFAQLGRAVGQTSEKVKNNLDQMIERGLLENISINEHDKTIQYLYDYVPRGPVTYVQRPPEPTNTPAKCNGCGAITVIPKGKVGICQYCGSRIEAE